MDSEEVREIVYQEVRHIDRKRFKFFDCPVCNYYTEMIRIIPRPAVTEDAVFERKWRCLNCMNIFVEKLELVKETKDG